MVTDVTPVYADVKDYVECLLEEELDKLPSYDKWINDCNDIKKRFPILLEKQETGYTVLKVWSDK